MRRSEKALQVAKRRFPTCVISSFCRRHFIGMKHPKVAIIASVHAGVTRLSYVITYHITAVYNKAIF
jgi:hypothetical protein